LDTPQYCCPNCHGNRARFALVFPLVQAVDKDPRSGRVTATVGEPVVERERRSVRCRSCGFEGPESMFAAEARRRPLY
jgi:hypothetical protein